MPKSPDPQLGLARLYVYGLRISIRPMPRCSRPSATAIAWAIARRPNWPTATASAPTGSGTIRATSAGCPQEKDQVQKVAEDYRRALQLYQGIAPYGNASAHDRARGIFARKRAVPAAAVAGRRGIGSNAQLGGGTPRAPCIAPLRANAWPAATFLVAAGLRLLIAAGLYLVLRGQVAAVRAGGKRISPPNRF